MFLSRPIFDRNKARFILAVVTASDHARRMRNSMAHILAILGQLAPPPVVMTSGTSWLQVLRLRFAASSAEPVFLG